MQESEVHLRVGGVSSPCLKAGVSTPRFLMKSMNFFYHPCSDIRLAHALSRFGFPHAQMGSKGAQLGEGPYDHAQLGACRAALRARHMLDGHLEDLDAHQLEFA